MGAKIIQMKIYQMHDYDLLRYYVSLCNCEEKSNRSRLSHIMKELLCSYVRGTEYTVPLVKNFSSIEPKGVVRIRFKLNEKEDADVIAYLRQVKRRQVNGFLKNLLRQNLDLSILQSYFSDNNNKAISKVEFYENGKSLNARKHAEHIRNISEPKKKVKSEPAVIKEKTQSSQVSKSNTQPELKEAITETDIQTCSQANDYMSETAKNMSSGNNDAEQEFNFFGEIGKLMGGF